MLEPKMSAIAQMLSFFMIKIFAKATLKDTRLDYCQYLLVSQTNYTLTYFVDHCE